MFGCWKTRVRVRCYVRCSKPNDLTCVRLILTCSVSNVRPTKDVSVRVRWTDVLFCSMFGNDSPWTVHGLSMDCPWTVHGLSMDRVQKLTKR